VALLTIHDIVKPVPESLSEVFTNVVEPYVEDGGHLLQVFLGAHADNGRIDPGLSCKPACAIRIAGS